MSETAKQTVIEQVKEQENSNESFLARLKKSPSRFLRSSVKLLASDGIESGYAKQAEEWGVVVDENGLLVELKPVDILKLPKVFISRSPLTTRQGTNVLESISETGVYGGSGEYPTYFSPDGIQIETTQRIEGEALKVSVDPVKLRNQRDIYVDPETFEKRKHLNLKQRENEVPGSSFFCLGGIPKDCIISIETYDSDKQ